MNKSWTRVVAAIGLGGGLALAAPALPAVGDHSPSRILHVEVGDEGRVVAKGAAVVVPVEVACEAGEHAFLDVHLTQARGRHVATGFRFENVDCTGTTQVVEVLVSANEGAFKKGVALARASLFVCDGFGCDEVEDTEEIRLS
jgi:predicted aspartyl protease